MQLNFHLQSLVHRRWEELRNWKQFMKDIEDRNSAGKGVDRRKLQKIAEADNRVTLTIGDLRVLQEYFVDLNYVQIQENFMFRAPGSLMDALHGEKAITIFYPSRYQATTRTEDTSRYDVRAFEALMRTPEISSLRVSLQDVFHHGIDISSPSQLEKRIREEAWYERVREPKAFISIGSPFSCYATEKLLCRMFELTPFKRREYREENRLPFYLYWPDKDETSHSAFAITSKDLEVHYRDQFAALGPNTRAVLIGDKLHPAPRVGESLNLVIAQYWQSHLRLVLLGIYAPATLAIAECLADRLITEPLGPYRFRTHTPKGKKDVQPILINQIQTTIAQAQSRTRGKATRDMREVADKKVLSWQRWQVVNGRYECLNDSQNKIAGEDPDAQ
jgi:hypothetical protein